MNTTVTGAASEVSRQRSSLLFDRLRSGPLASLGLASLDDIRRRFLRSAHESTPRAARTGSAAILDPQSILDRIERAATRHETPCGDGRMVWHAWGEGRALVLLHGGTGSWRHWVRNIEPLADGRRVVCADLPGLGCSDMPPDPENPPAMAAILARGLDAVIGRDAAYDVAGFSYGGVMAGVLAAQDAGRVRSVTIVGSGGLGLPRGRTELVKVRHLEGAARVAAHRTNLATLMIADPARIDDLALAIQDWNTRHSRLKSPEISRGTWLRDALAGLHCQVNGIWGSLDAPSLPDIAARERAMRALQPGLRFRAIAGAGHWVAYEAAAAFNATLRDMLEQEPLRVSAQGLPGGPA